jgi:hypothetical protein
VKKFVVEVVLSQEFGMLEFWKFVKNPSPSSKVSGKGKSSVLFFVRVYRTPVVHPLVQKRYIVGGVERSRDREKGVHP